MVRGHGRIQDIKSGPTLGRRRGVHIGPHGLLRGPREHGQETVIAHTPELEANTRAPPWTIRLTNRSTPGLRFPRWEICEPPGCRSGTGRSGIGTKAQLGLITILNATSQVHAMIITVIDVTLSKTALYPFGRFDSDWGNAFVFVPVTKNFIVGPDAEAIATVTGA